MDSGGPGEMTLAFSLAALKRLADPKAAFSETMEWSKYVGVVSDKPQYVAMKFTRDHQLPKHFLPRPGGEKRQTLEDVHSVSSEYEATDRYVFVGTTETDRDIADATDWEYIPIKQAADAAGWSLVSAPDESSPQRIEEVDRDDWP